MLLIKALMESKKAWWVQTQKGKETRIINGTNLKVTIILINGITKDA